MSYSVDLIKRLTLTDGVSGHEGKIASIIREELEGVGQISTDSIGNVVCTIAASAKEAPTLLFAAHQDEIGFMVNNISERGFISFIPIGGWNKSTLYASAVNIVTKEGDVPGIIGILPPHFLNTKEQTQEELYIDIGAKSKKEVSEIFHVAIGDIVVPSSRFIYNESQAIVMSKAFDDRIGVAALCELGKLVAQKRTKINITLLFTVQEEVGTRGAQVASNYIDSDAAIIVEGAPADDTPGGPSHPQTKVGGGAHIRIYDPTHIGNPHLLNNVREIAQKREIQIQEAIRTGGGTDAKEIALAHKGIPTIVTGVPVRYAHSHNGLISLNDYRQLVTLLYALSEDMSFNLPY